jgi:transposase
MTKATRDTPGGSSFTPSFETQSSRSKTCVLDTVHHEDAQLRALPIVRAQDNGRKRHIGVDTLGLLLTVMVTAASVTDREAGRTLLEQLRMRHWRITLVWADGGYTGRPVDLARDVLHIALTVIKRSDNTSGFTVLPKRWLVERTFAWLMRSRRLARDYEGRADTSEAMIRWSMSMVMSRRLAGRAR